jgi:FtsZ-interacting cell division protein ZipA
MSELQLGLLVIGAVVVIAVLAYNKWQEVRYRREAEQAFGVGHDDVLMAPSGQESVVTSSQEALQESTPSEQTERIEPTLDGVDSGAESAGSTVNIPEAVPAATVAPLAILNGGLDHILEMAGRSPIDGARAITRAAELLQNFSHPVYLEILDVDHDRWTALTHERTGKQLRAGLQLVSRRGAVTSDEIDRFSQAVGLLAQELGAVVGRSAQPAQAIARDLDRFCGEVDIQIAINVVSAGNPFTGPALRDFATARGFSLDGDGRFHCRDTLGREMCTIQNAGNAAFVAGSLDTLNTIAVTVELDVPRAPGNLQAFDDCVAIARQLAAALGGQLADDNGVPLTEAGLAAIRTQLEPIYAAMTAKGIPAGSPQALRLFS